MKGKVKSEIDFMCLTMIDPATSWFKIVELLVVKLSATTAKDKKARRAKGRRLIMTHILINHQL